MKNTILLGTALGILLAGAATAQGGTDDCVAPTILPGEGSYTFDTTNTQESSDYTEGTCADGDNTGSNYTGGFNHDKFWVFSVGAAGNLTIDTVGTPWDTDLAIYSGVDCSATCVVEDGDSGGNLNSSVVIPSVSIGDTFLIQIGGFAASEFGSGLLNIDVGLTASGPCDSGTTISGLGAFAWDSTGVISSGFVGDGGNCSGGVNQDVFMQWTAPVDGDYEFDTAGTAHDTIMAIYSGIGCAATCIDWNDGSHGVHSTTFAYGLAAGDPVLIQLGGSSGNEGPGVLNILTTSIGNATCPGVVNSTGVGANLVGFGTNVATDNAFGLLATNLPANQLGYFIASKGSGTPVVVPGSVGTLCIGGGQAIARFVAQSVGYSNAIGNFKVMLDLTTVPLPPPMAGAIVGGETWYFQQWGRDDLSGTPTLSNFSSGLEVLFQ